jgi:hypothetical protein
LDLDPSRQPQQPQASGNLSSLFGSLFCGGLFGGFKSLSNSNFNLGSLFCSPFGKALPHGNLGSLFVNLGILGNGKSRRILLKNLQDRSPQRLQGDGVGVPTRRRVHVVSRGAPTCCDDT